MASSHLGLKISTREKEALDYITEKSHITRSGLLYPAIKTTIHRSLGLVLIYTIGYRTKADYEEMIGMLKAQAPNMESIHHFNLPHSVEAFFTLLSRKKFWTAYTLIFNGIKGGGQTTKNLPKVVDIDLWEVAEHVGNVYITLGGSFETINLNLAKSILFERLLWEHFHRTTQYPFNEAKRVWAMHKGEIRALIAEIIPEYDNEFEAGPVEALTVVRPEKRRKKEKAIPKVGSKGGAKRGKRT